MSRSSTRTPLILITLMIVCSGCASLMSKESNLPERQSATVATDFVAALSLLRGHSPRTTTLQVRPPKTQFDRSLSAELRKAGYGMQTVPDGDTGPMLVTYEADSYENSDHRSVAYRVRVGNVELGREYELRNGHVFPITSLSVRGVEIASQPLDQSIFERHEHELISERQSLVSPARELASADLLNDTMIDSQEGWSAVPSTAIPIMDDSAPAVALNQRDSKSITLMDTPGTDVSERLLQNVLIRGDSNFTQTFAGYADVRQGTLVFPNDSMRMGRDVKQQTQSLLEGFNAETDIVSVLGCSHGATNIEGGNKVLALGRAQRVVEELIDLSVPKDKIYDEGCWAGIGQAELPARGVIVTLKRKT